MKILIVFPHNPFLGENGVQSRFYGLLKYFRSRGIAADILSHENFVDEWSDEHINHSLVRKVYLNDFRKSMQNHTAEKSVLPDFAFADLKKQLMELAEENEYDFVLVSYVYWAGIVDELPPNIVKVITIEDFISLNEYERRDADYDIGMSINDEIRKINLFDRAVCISKDEMAFFERVCRKVEFYNIPHFMDLPVRGKTETHKDIDLLFVGSDNPSNRRGIKWFLDEVFPLLPGGISVKIAGGVGKFFETPDVERVGFLGHVDNIEELYERAKLTFCPLQDGTGLKIKVVESLAAAVPVVTTSYGVVGMDKKYNGCCVAETPAEFAESVFRLLNDTDLYSFYSKEAEEYFKNNFSSEINYRKLDEVFCIDGSRV